MVHGEVRNTEGDLLVPDVLAEDGVEHGTERGEHHLLPGHGSVAAEEGHVPHGVPGGEVLQQGGPVPRVLQFGHFLSEIQNILYFSVWIPGITAYIINHILPKQK